jgi:putative transposase
MPRSARASAGGLCYHINRGNARAEVFHKPEDIDAFLRIMGEAGVRMPMRIIAYCVLPANGTRSWSRFTKNAKDDRILEQIQAERKAAKWRELPE